MTDSTGDLHVGRVVALFRYPVKSMAGEELSAVDVSWHGVVGDRRWAFVREGIPESGFPWLTLRQNGAMAHYHASFAEPDDPDKSPTLVRTPGGVEYDVTDPALATELSAQSDNTEHGARVLRQKRGIFDAFPLTVITRQSVRGLGRMVGAELDVRRFRPNILVEATGASSQSEFPEDDWVGRVLRIGSMRMRVDKRDGRCAVITIDPDTTERDPSILRTVTEQREKCLGVYGSTVEPGRVAVGDDVVVEKGG